MQSTKYTAVVLDENGVDQGPVDISSAQDDEEARDLATRQGAKWLADNGLNRATIQISHNGRGLTVKVQT
jgi:hypothetical protein